jgi:hypothetical protein
MLQTRDYQTKAPKFWPDGNPQMAAVFKVQLDGSGEVRSVWAKRPGGLFSALQAAQEASGARIGPGGRVAISFTGYGQAEAGKNPPKVYAARYEPPNTFGGRGAGQGAPAPQQPPAQPQQPPQGWPPNAQTGQTYPAQPPASYTYAQQPQQQPQQQPPGQGWAQAQQAAGNPQDAGAAALAHQQAQPAAQAAGQPPMGPYTEAQIAAARAAGVQLPGA